MARPPKWKPCKKGCLDNIPKGREDDDAYFEAQMKNNYPLLNDGEFVNRYPLVIRVSEALEDLAELRKAHLSESEYFKTLNIQDVNGFLEILYKNNFKAIQVYNEVQNAYGFKEDKRESVLIAPTESYTPELDPRGGVISVGGLKNTSQLAAK